MTIFIEKNNAFGTWEITQSGGFGILESAETKSEAKKKARKFAEKGEDIAVQNSSDKQFSSLL